MSLHTNTSYNHYKNLFEMPSSNQNPQKIKPANQESFMKNKQSKNPSSLFLNMNESQYSETTQKSYENNDLMKFRKLNGWGQIPSSLPSITDSQQFGNKDTKVQQKDEQHLRSVVSFGSDNSELSNGWNGIKSSPLLRDMFVAKNHSLGERNIVSAGVIGAGLYRSSLSRNSINYSDNIAKESVISYRNSHSYIERQILVDGAVAYIVRRNKQGLNAFWPVYDMHYYLDNQYFVSGKLTGNNTTVTYCLAHSKKDFQQNGEFYAGKVKSNFIGSLTNIYSPGYTLANLQKGGSYRQQRQIIATVQYQTNFLGQTRPRDFHVYIIKKGFSYYEDLEGVSKKEEIPLSKLYEIDANRDKIFLLRNRKPVWNSQIKAFQVNFGGRIKIPSVKNFMLQDLYNPQKCYMLFGKLNQNEFRLDVGQPVTPTVALGIALSQFGNKFGLQGYH